ncbi:MAG: hypothetical protein WCW13_04270 [archaeon]
MGAHGQSSLEYLIILAAFFGVLALVLPVITESTQGFLSASDDMLAKRIAEETTNQISLMSFLGEGSEKTLAYSPIKQITVYSQNNDFFVETQNKKYSVTFSSPQLVLKQDFNSKFNLTFKKIGENVQVFVNSAS